jgi:diaminopimelate decarboxylase
MIQTPFYYYDTELLSSTLEALHEAIGEHNFKIHYAIKANSETRILEIIESHGLGTDCVSGNEIKKSLENGFKAEEIVFAGVGKTDDEIRTAITNNILSINCESIEEFEVINEIAAEMGKTANIALRLNPNIDAHTHHHITTGLDENKFGISVEDLDFALEELKKHPNLNLNGIHFHIGSQIMNLHPYIKLCYVANDILGHLKKKKINIKHINMGGGLGINYSDPEAQLIPDFKNYFDIFKKNLKVDANQTVHFELGRSIVGQMGSLISKVLYVKKGKSKNFAIIDAGMTDLIRPALYNAEHKIENISSKETPENYQVVGPICESTDNFGLINLSATSRGNYLKIRSAGAYGQVLSSNYNLRENARAVYSDMYDLEKLPKNSKVSNVTSQVENNEVQAVLV